MSSSTNRLVRSVSLVLIGAALGALAALRLPGAHAQDTPPTMGAYLQGKTVTVLTTSRLDDGTEGTFGGLSHLGDATFIKVETASGRVYFNLDQVTVVGTSK